MEAILKIEITYDTMFNTPEDIAQALRSGNCFLNGIRKVEITDMQDNCPCCGRRKEKKLNEPE